jgi:signal transduction histidine kinase/3D (Asp-Asp-Asp) domain-containing protein
VETAHPNFIVGIGGSAGALNAYRALLDALPSNTDMAFVVVAHMHPATESHLAQILSRHTNMPVMVAGATMPIQANHVYVIPVNTDLTIEGYAFKVVSPRARRAEQIDLFFNSLAETMGAHSIGVVLSGYGGDGSEGCKHIKAKGGITFAQDESAEVGSMPVSAQASGAVDFILPPDKISDELAKIGVRYRQDKCLENNRKTTDESFGQKNTTIDEETDEAVRLNRRTADEDRDNKRAKTDIEQSESRLALTGGQSSRWDDSDLVRERERSDEAQNVQRAEEDRVHFLERFQKRLIAAALVETERNEANAIRLDERVRTDLVSRQSFRLLSEEKTSHNVTQATLASRDLFLQVVSHDLRSPLGVISVCVGVIRKILSNVDKDIGSLVRSLEMIERNTATMDRMISDLLDVERMANGKLILRTEKCDMRALLRETKELFAPVLATRSIAMTIQTGREPLFVDIDHDRVLQVLSNLIGNALKFTHVGGVIKLSARRKKTEIEISVIDNGPGIPEDKMSEVFERFSQLKTNDRRGLGLGLFISKWIVEAHSGRIEVASKVGKGSTFSFTLPVKSSER